MAKKGNVLQQLGSLIGLVLIIVVITALNPAFIEIPNLFNILRQVSINALIAFGMTFVILTGGIDLSVGSILALSSALVAGMMASGMDPFLAMVVGLLAGLAMGIVNGIIIAKGKSSSVYCNFSNNDYFSRVDACLYGRTSDHWSW